MPKAVYGFGPELPVIKYLGFKLIGVSRGSLLKCEELGGFEQLRFYLQQSGRRLIGFRWWGDLPLVSQRRQCRVIGSRPPTVSKIEPY